MESSPERCPQCGAVDEFRAQYTTGGGWHIAYYICEKCGHQHNPHLDD